MRSARELYSLLISVHGTPPWWSYEPFTVMVQAVLVQNTAWENVLRVSAALGEKLSARWVLSCTEDELESAIRPCGFQKAKAGTIRRLAQWWEGHGHDQKALMAMDSTALRMELMAIKGIGRESADVIMLYAFFHPVFVVDAYTRRIMHRLGHNLDDEGLRAFFEAGFSAAELGAMHWLFLETGKAWCRKSASCGQCPLSGACKRRID